MYPLVCPLCRIALPTVDDVCPRDGRAGVEAAWLPVPPALSQRFHVVEPFAHGDMGSLYLADEPETGRRGLLKVLAPLFREQHGDRQRLRRELVKQATLQRGALVVPLASGESDGATWIFREWLDGVSLEVRLSREGALQQTEALAIAAQIATALDELHRGGLLHRDVKPGHVFLQPTSHGIPRAFLLDAGVAVALQTANGGRLHGTPGYLAPEQLTGGLVSFRSDLYSLGCVLYRMLTGRPAFAGESREETLLAQRRGELPPTPAALPNGIGSLLQSILSRDPQERPFSAQKLRRTLEPFLPDGALMEKQPPTSTFETVPQPRPSTAPQPSGTLRPPPPPSTRPASAQGPTGATLPPGALRNKPPASREPTHQLDVDQLIELEELLPPPKKATSVPPPMPERALSSSRPPLPSKKPAPPSEKTQPIRLDQILAVAAARKTNAPPVAPEPPHVPEPVHAAVVDTALHEASLFEGAELEEAGPVALDADDVGDHDATTQLSTSEARPDAPRAPSAQAAVATAKATLMGVGGDPMEPPAALSALDTPAPEQATRSERDHPTERVAVGGSADLEDNDASQAVTGGLPASLLNTLGGGRTDSRRLIMYASAALVGLGVLGVGASALIAGNDDAARESAMVAPPPLPAAAEEAKAAEAVARAEPTTLPTVEPVATATPVAPAAVQQLADNAAEDEKLSREASAEAAKQEKLAQAQARAEERRLAKEAREEERRLAKQARQEERRAAREARASKEASSRDLLAADEANRKRERASRSGTTSAKTASGESGDKATSFAEAREQARSHYAAKRYKEAAAAYERAAKLEPSHAGTFAGLGAARLQIGDNKGALQAYQRAVQLSPDTSGFHAALGRAYLANGDKSRAIASYKKALSLDSKNEAAKAALRQLAG